MIARRTASLLQTPVGRVTTLAGVLVMLSAWTYARSRLPDAPRSDFATSVPLVFGAWAGLDAPPLPPEIARVLAADQYVHRFYGPRKDSQEWHVTGGEPMIEMDIAYYSRPRAGAAMHSPLNCLPGYGWQIIESGQMAVPIGSAAVNVRRLVVSQGSQRLVMTYWFQNRSAVIATEYRQRLQLLASGLQGRPTGAALVRVMAADTPAADDMLGRFTRELLGILTRTF